MANIPGNGRFLYSALTRFTPQDAMAFFEGLGVPLKVERGNRVFPVSDRSFDISGALERRAAAPARPLGAGPGAWRSLVRRTAHVTGCTGREAALSGMPP